MDAAQFGVTIGGATSIAAVIWYFFLGERARAAAAVGASGVQELEVRVKGGYEPDVLVVRKGAPVRLNFTREETSACSEIVVFGDFGIAKPLPAFRTTPVEFTPQRAGTYTFTCGMGMLHGRLVVEDDNTPG